MSRAIDLLEKRVIPGRVPENANFYGLEYFSGGESNGHYSPYQQQVFLDPRSDYRFKAQDAIKWVAPKIPKDGILIDAGAGPAHLAYWVKKLNLPFSAISLDFSFPIAAYVRERSRNEGEYVVGQISQLPFQDSSLDGILFSDVLEHLSVEDTITTTLEAKRALKPGAHVFINIPNRITWSDKALKYGGHVWIPTAGEMSGFLQEMGFVNAEATTRGFPGSLPVRRLTGHDIHLPFFGRSILISAQNPA